MTPGSRQHRQWPVALLWAQGIYYLATGIWPLVSMKSFQWVTGRKTDHLVTGNEADHWLVMTVGALVTAISLQLLVSAWRRRPEEAAVLAAGSALALSTIDVIYVIRGTIEPIYLGDAAAELMFLIGWAAWEMSRRRS